jgi:cytochrome c-type biogenesis protein CcmH
MPSATLHDELRTSRRLKLGIGLFVVAFSAALYMTLGHVDAWSVGPGSAAPPQAMPADVLPGIEQMVERLAARLAANPEDEQGWALLARSYEVLQRPDDARAARDRLQALQARKGAAAPGVPARVAGIVELAPSLRAQAAPDDTVFVFARAADGPGMPLAIARVKVRELPYRFAFDDKSAMNPARPLSSASQVVVGARVSHSGDAVARSGDLQGFSAPVKLGTSDLRVEIAEAVR